MIKEIIVVEGRDDILAIKRAVDAEIIATNGFGINEDKLRQIETAAKKRGIIIFTDPDFAGEKIRRMISKRVKNCKHAFIPREKAIKDGDIGVENASPQAIIDALKKARAETKGKRIEFTKNDLVKYGLSGTKNAGEKRDELGKILGIGYCNSKQFLNRLNNYGITREEFLEAIRRINSDYER